MENQNSESWESSAEGCWFCKVSESRGGELHVPMHYTLSEKQSYDKVEYEYSQANVEVPRCWNCQRTHHTIWLTLTLLQIAMIAVGILTIGVFHISWFTTLFFSLALVVILFAFSFIYLVPIVYLANFLGVNTEWRLRGHPLIQAYKDEGWKIGESPIWQYTYCQRVKYD